MNSWGKGFSIARVRSFKAASKKLIYKVRLFRKKSVGQALFSQPSVSVSKQFIEENSIYWRKFQNSISYRPSKRFLSCKKSFSSLVGCRLIPYPGSTIVITPLKNQYMVGKFIGTIKAVHSHFHTVFWFHYYSSGIILSLRRYILEVSKYSWIFFQKINIKKF